MHAIVESWGRPLKGTKRLVFFSTTEDTTLGLPEGDFPVVACNTERSFLPKYANEKPFRGKIGGNRRFPHLLWHLSKDSDASVKWVIYMDSDAALNLPALLEVYFSLVCFPHFEIGL